MADNDTLHICVADLPICVECDGLPMQSVMDKETYSGFACGSAAQAFVRFHIGDVGDSYRQKREGAVEAHGPWDVNYGNGVTHFIVKRVFLGEFPYPLFTVDRGSRHGNVTVAPSYRTMPAAGIQPNRLELWVFQAFMTCLMGRGRGLMLHAAGVEVGGNGYLFAGHSNDGKSTLAGLWKGRGQVLNDDRVIVRRRENRFVLYGTPWHGDYDEVSYGGVPLRKMFFLNKAKHTGIQPVQGAEACAALIARSFSPLWDEHAMRLTLDFCARMISEVPCFELSFAPNESVIDFLVALM